jgi:hypothetical protein
MPLRIIVDDTTKLPLGYLKLLQRKCRYKGACFDQAKYFSLRARSMYMESNAAVHNHLEGYVCARWPTRPEGVRSGQGGTGMELPLPRPGGGWACTFSPRAS